MESPQQCCHGGGLMDKDCCDSVYNDTDNKVKSCLNPTYECSLPRIEGHNYCIRHILYDSLGNFRQCSYIYFNGRKCPNALFKHDIKADTNFTTLCFKHNRQMQLQKTRVSTGKLKQVDTNEVLLNNLAHHINVEETVNNCEQDDEIDVVSAVVQDFVPHEHIHSLSDVVANIRKRRRILDYASDSSSNDEIICMNNTSRDIECNESENESVDSDEEDALKYAGIYTVEELLRISEAKLTKLQGLYINQINRLHNILKEKRRIYLRAIRKEREYLCSIHDQLKETPKERVLYEQLKALNSYHRRHGVEAVLYKKFKERRNRVSEGYLNKPVGFSKCAFTEGGVKCIDRSLPSSKYCRKHILEDKKQILFKACGKEKSGIVCQEPIPNIFDDSTCVLHLSIPQQRQYVQKKYESETEEDDLEMKLEFGQIVSDKTGESNEVNSVKNNTPMACDEK